MDLGGCSSSEYIGFVQEVTAEMKSLPVVVGGTMCLMFEPCVGSEKEEGRTTEEGRSRVKIRWFRENGGREER